MVAAVANAWMHWESRGVRIEHPYDGLATTSSQIWIRGWSRPVANTLKVHVNEANGNEKYTEYPGQVDPSTGQWKAKLWVGAWDHLCCDTDYAVAAVADSTETFVEGSKVLPAGRESNTVVVSRQKLWLSHDASTDCIRSRLE